MSESKTYIGVDGQSVEVSGTELEKVNQAQNSVLAMRNQLISEQNAAATARASAIAKLEALGLTINEISAAFGIEEK